MRSILVVALAVAAGLASAGCGSTGSGGASAEVAAAGGIGMTLTNYEVIWTRGGKLGYLRTYLVADAKKPGEKGVPIHYVLDLDLKTDRGWVADNGLGARFEYPAAEVREARRMPFEVVELPADSLHNQIKRILGVDPATEIKLVPASSADVRR